jgi:hypothetical protein
MSTPASTKSGFTQVRVSDTLEVDGIATFEQGISFLSAPTGVANKDVSVATDGTDTTPATGTQFVTSIFTPTRITVTNVNYLIGSVGGTDRVYAVLYSSTGAVLGNSTLAAAGTVVGTAANIQTLALTTPVTIPAGRFFIGISMNGATARIRTVPAHCQVGILGATVSQTHATVAAITPPATFTANQAPYVFIN